MRKFKLSSIFNSIVNILLLITFYIMISGFSSFLNQEFSVNRVLGSVIIVVLCYIAFKRNIEGLVKVSDFLIPLLTVFILYISSRNLNVVDNYNSVFETFLPSSNGGWSVLFQAILKAILYASYNCILLIPVIVTLKKYILKSENIICISIMSFVFVSILSLSVYNILLIGDNNIFSLEMPVIEIVKKYGAVCKNVYLCMIGISIYTTAISTGCGFLNNCSNKKHTQKRNLIFMCVSAIFLSQISFSTLVNLLYPVLGIFGLIEIFLL